MRKVQNHCALHTTALGHGSDRWPCTVIEGSRRNGLGPNQAALVKVSALEADDNLPHAHALEAT